ncbi:MAG: hypothetical protein DRP63_01960 [Planctomycetota bacterium]|nr:MAG: hypothetical protein DRP63_01960 [Planctomycetota bacterium]
MVSNSNRITARGLEALYRAAVLLNAGLSLEETLQRITNAITDVMGYPVCSVRLLDRARGVLVTMSAKGTCKEYLQLRKEVKLGEDVSGRAVQTGQPQFVEDVTQENLSETARKLVEKMGVKTYIAVPIRVMDEVVGVFSVMMRRKRRLTESEKRLLELFAEQAGVAIHRARLYEALRQSERSFRELFKRHSQILENIPAGVVWLDKHLRIGWENAEARRIFGTPGVLFDRLVGKDIREVGGVKKAGLVKKLTRLMEGKEFRWEGAYTSSSGKRCYIATVGVPVIEGGEFCGAVVVVNDISDRVVAERARRKLQAQRMVLKRLRELNRLKNQFVELVAHELRTPITPMKSLVQMFLDETFGPLTPKQREQMEVLARNMERLARFTKDVLSLSRADADEYPLRPRNFRLKKMIEPVVKLVENKARAVGIVISDEVPPDIRVHADPDAVAEVLTNLLVNAVTHCPPRTKVVVTAKVRGKNTEIAVSDNGSGIPPDILKQVFEPFVQGERKAGSGYRGVGIGLAVCKAIVEKMGGKIWVQNNQDGGATFKFTLPTAKSQ